MLCTSNKCYVRVVRWSRGSSYSQRFKHLKVHADWTCPKISLLWRSALYVWFEMHKKHDTSGITQRGCVVSKLVCAVDRRRANMTNIPMHLGLLGRSLSTRGFLGDRRYLPLAYGINRVPIYIRVISNDMKGLLISRVRSEWRAAIPHTD